MCWNEVSNVVFISAITPEQILATLLKKLVENLPHQKVLSNQSLIKNFSKRLKSLYCDGLYLDSPLLCITYNCITYTVMQFKCELLQWVSVYWLRCLSKHCLLAQRSDSLLVAVQMPAPEKQHCASWCHFATFNIGFLRKNERPIILLSKSNCPTEGTVQEVQISQTNNKKKIHSHLYCRLSGSCSSK